MEPFVIALVRGEAALTATYIINCLPSSVIDNQSLYERLYGTPPNYSLLKVFGCACFVLLQPHEHTKLEPRARLCCFLGYGIEHKGYRCWDPVSNRLRISKHVIFWEHKLFSSMSKFSSESHLTPFFTQESIELFPDNTDPSNSDESSADMSTELLPAPEPTTLPSGSTADTSTVPPSTSSNLPPIPRQSNRVRELPIRLRDYHCFSTTLSLYELQSYSEVCSNPIWQQAMAEELQALEKSHTWDLVDLPSQKSAIGCKWVYKIKTKADGSIKRYKVKLVAKGFNQEYGVDYEETFATVAYMTSVRSLLAVAAIRRWTLSQMDVKNAFLNGDLAEDVYMKPPPGYAHPSHKVCKLRRALYGLKQAPRACSSLSSLCPLFFTSFVTSRALYVMDFISLLIHLYHHFCVFLGDFLISWRCKKQTVVARSSTEAEYRALADITQEITWLYWLLSDIGVPHSGPTPLAYDNSSAIHIAHNDVFYERTKHIEVDCHFIHQHITQGTIVLRSISSLDQLADLFTKSHHRGRFCDLLSKLKITFTPPS
ncbi:Retrovirus-related Pol polyprotein from transposon TNT 1-94 [Melia azedarach]|uniref:Retrovirus-related Pol polyprotein from transposon TNT 1-94 n=1 Tax=Melia azedarach TaxID=155640 RepID=A0ACC1Y5L6_MELAZ|nr:Retrovirus-related Pol polyprotein from transposon TNT 1-94 [Melia azedarach]